MRRFGAMVLAFGAMLALSACAGKTTGATNITDVSAMLHATARCDGGETCTWYWQYWPVGRRYPGAKNTPVQGPVAGPTGDRQLSTTITGLQPSTTYRWVFCASPNDGVSYACAGPHGTFSSPYADPPPDYATFTTIGQRTLAERWNGSAWHVQLTHNPSAGVHGVFLNGVSCTAATACTAVGSFPSGTLAERWDGSTWTIQPTPNPTSTGGTLSAVSCTSATACTAVGSSASGTLAERWDGTTWTIQPTPNPAGTKGTLSGVSCTSATACTAVGSYVQSGTELTLAERWDGTTWTIQPTPNPTGTTINTLSGVSCTSAAACTAVGYYFNSGGTQISLAERWDGTTWTIQPTPSPTGATTYSPLSGVSCTLATACTAVGSYVNSSGSLVTLAERWDGTSWTIQPTPNPTAGVQGSFLNGVSCTSATTCTAVGDYLNSAGASLTLAEHWNGTTWTIQPSPSPIGMPALVGVSCSSDSACTAVGTR